MLVVKSAARPRRSDRPKGAYGNKLNFVLRDVGFGPQESEFVGTLGHSNRSSDILLVDLLVGWLVGWLVGCLVGWLVNLCINESWLLVTTLLGWSTLVGGCALLHYSTKMMSTQQARGSAFRLAGDRG